MFFAPLLMNLVANASAKNTPTRATRYKPNCTNPAVFETKNAPNSVIPKATNANIATASVISRIAFLPCLMSGRASPISMRRPTIPVITSTATPIYLAPSTAPRPTNIMVPMKVSSAPAIKLRAKLPNIIALRRRPILLKIRASPLVTGSSIFTDSQLIAINGSDIPSISIAFVRSRRAPAISLTVREPLTIVWRDLGCESLLYMS